MSTLPPGYKHVRFSISTAEGIEVLVEKTIPYGDLFLTGRCTVLRPTLGLHEADELASLVREAVKGLIDSKWVTISA
jgi:hypothetical protein